jgi:hypothetical protein
MVNWVLRLLSSSITRSPKRAVDGSRLAETGRPKPLKRDAEFLAEEEQRERDAQSLAIQLQLEREDRRKAVEQVHRLNQKARIPKRGE